MRKCNGQLWSMGEEGNREFFKCEKCGRYSSGTPDDRCDKKPIKKPKCVKQ